MKSFLTILMTMTLMSIGLAASAQEVVKETVHAPISFLPAGTTQTEIDAALAYCEAVLPDLKRRIAGGPGCVADTMNDGSIMVRPGAELRKAL